MSAKAAIRARSRWRIKFRNVARLGRSIYPKPVAKEIAAERLLAVMAREQRIKRKK